MVDAVTAMRVLCLNAGSSSLKFALYDVTANGESPEVEGMLEGIGLPDGRLQMHGSALAAGVDTAGVFPDAPSAVRAMFAALDATPLARADAVGHRFAHGGPHHLMPTRVDDALLAALHDAVPFAPLHLPAEIAGLVAATAREPAVPQVVCFDTGFHRTLPEVARRFPLPRAYADRGVRRYGFHGLSYEFVVSHVGAQSLGRAVVAHLGNGASLAAIRNGVSVDTTMGFTPAGGVMMGTRTGDLDPGLVVHLLDHGHDVRSLERLILREGGLLGVSGTSPDVRTLLASRDHDRDAALALEMFCQHVRKAIGALTTVLGGLDTLVFTGGIGEHAVPVRAEICEGLEHLGIVIDPTRNAASREIIGRDGAPVTVRVVHTDEERMIARHTRRVLAG